jgi:hypothetical protein
MALHCIAVAAVAMRHCKRGVYGVHLFCFAHALLIASAASLGKYAESDEEQGSLRMRR